MSTAVVEQRAVPARPNAHWQQQLGAVIRLELRKTFPVRTILALSLLALAPMAILTLRLVGIMVRGVDNPAGDASTAFATMFQTFSLRFILCLGCAAIFGTIVRREQLDLTLHYYLLSPVRREVLIGGKYVAALIVSVVVLGLSTLGCFFLAFAPFTDRTVSTFFFSGPGLAHLAAYLLVTALACAAYGAVFMAFGAFVRNPVLPALGVLFWEGLHGFLPATLQHFSIAHYLLGLCPLHLQEGVFSVLTEPPSAWVSVPVLLALVAAGVGLAAYRARSLRIQYDFD
jgi:hypothetical protein